MCSYLNVTRVVADAPRRSIRGMKRCIVARRGVHYPAPVGSNGRDRGKTMRRVLPSRSSSSRPCPLRARTACLRVPVRIDRGTVIISTSETVESFRSVCACHIDNPIVVSTRHVDAPWIAANLAVLNEAPANVRLDVDFHVLAAKRTRDHKFICHLPISYRNAGQLYSRHFCSTFVLVRQSPLPGLTRGAPPRACEPSAPSLRCCLCGLNIGREVECVPGIGISG